MIDAACCVPAATFEHGWSPHEAMPHSRGPSKLSYDDLFRHQRETISFGCSNNATEIGAVDLELAS